MTASDAAGFAGLMGELGEVYREEVSTLRCSLYFEALESLSLEAVREAARELVKTSRFFPKPSEIYDIACEKRMRALVRPGRTALYPHVEQDDGAIRGMLSSLAKKLGWGAAP